ncbi:hypothetical protein SBA5_1230008 [Candidatus Sulfotelmatomonas gaucii]|uniref:Uncharacterized protein n=1 Tax=Candidatus Sulfuritelmatomonas gaucii TaxID=2043161 RepID=A0A2N9L475_9BACT|nr:hypothetical protein SBA5_1230008 [Candidatus Sulfotelmatomonas gaucii]
MVDTDCPPPHPNRRIHTKDEKPIMSMIADLLQQKVGLSPDQAQQAEQVVVQHLMSKVPSEFQGMLGSVLGTGAAEGQPAAAESAGLSSLLGEATSLFGSNKS